MAALTPLDPDDPSYPDTSLIITHDGKAVDLFVEKQYRLLTEPLWTSWKSPEGRPFRVLANVGLFFTYKEPPLAPDAMFAIDVESPAQARESDSRSYFVWVVGKPPDVVIEVVSDKRGREDTDKLKAYQRINVPFYVIFDPDEHLDGGLLCAFGMQNGRYVPVDASQFGNLGLGLTLWAGEIEGSTDTWLRWIDADGKLVPNAKERAAAEMQRADEAQKRVEHLEAKLRAAGISLNGAG